MSRGPVARCSVLSVLHGEVLLEILLCPVLAVKHKAFVNLTAYCTATFMILQIQNVLSSQRLVIHECSISRTP